MSDTITATVLEGFPDEITARLEARDRRRRHEIPPYVGGNVAELVIGDLQLWQVGTLTVSFKDGDAALHAKIADVANRWTNYGDVTFDFGYDEKAGTFRQWNPDDHSHIRVGFEFKGYWSLVGTDAKDPSILSPGQITLNLEGFDVELPDDWEGTVLHEFGHALGFHHEHQSPAEICDFNWDLLYETLGRPPNSWPKWKVDHNLRQLPSGGLTFSPHDRDSIMHYSFPAWMFRSGDESPCFTQRNHALSGEDRRMMSVAYPLDEAASRRVNERRISYLDEILERSNVAGEERRMFEQHREFLSKR